MMQFSLQKKLQAANGVMELNVSCEIQQGQFVSLYRSSGAGETSVLRMLAVFWSLSKALFNSINRNGLPAIKRLLYPRKRGK